MTYQVIKEYYFQHEHDIVIIKHDKEHYKYLVLGDGMIPLHKNKSISDRDIVDFAKKSYFGKDVMLNRKRELLRPAGF